MTTGLSAETIQAYQEQELDIDPDDPLYSDDVLFSPHMKSRGLCPEAEKYFQETLLSYHDDTYQPDPRHTDEIGATAVYHQGNGVGVLKNLGEPTMLCTQTVHGEHNESLSQGYIYSVSPELQREATNEYRAVERDVIKYSKAQSARNKTMHRVAKNGEHHPYTVSDLLDHANKFVETPNHQLV